MKQNRDVRVVIQFATTEELEPTRLRMDAVFNRAMLHYGETQDEDFPWSYNREDNVRVEWDVEQPIPTVEEAFKAGWAARDVHLSSYLTAALSEEWANKDWLAYLRERG